MRLIQSALVLAFFLLGVGIMFLSASPGRDCASEGSFAAWMGSAPCAESVVVVEDELPAATPVTAPLPTRPRAAPRGEYGDSLAVLLAGVEQPENPEMVRSAQAAERVAVEVLPRLRPLHNRAPSGEEEAPLAGSFYDPAVAGGLLTNASPSRGEVAPIRLTSVPVPRDPAEAQRLLDARYPPDLRQSGVGGTVVLAIRIDRRGRVRDPQVVSGSGQERLDAAALEVVRVLRFSPAQQEGRSVETRILQPLVFRP